MGKFCNPTYMILRHSERMFGFCYIPQKLTESSSMRKKNSGDNFFWLCLRNRLLRVLRHIYKASRWRPIEVPCPTGLRSPEGVSSLQCYVPMLWLHSFDEPRQRGETGAAYWMMHPVSSQTGNVSLSEKPYWRELERLVVDYIFLLINCVNLNRTMLFTDKRYLTLFFGRVGSARACECSY